MDPRTRQLIHAASCPFRRAGIYPWQFALWKLRLDPVFLALLQGGHLPDGGRLVDVGCGQGVLLALLVAAREQFQRGEWPPGWTTPPLNLELQGVDRSKDRVWIARRALGESAQLERCDVREAAFPPCSAITALDLLQYLEPDDQKRLLEKAAAALDPGGMLLVRETDAAAGFAYQLSRWSARLGVMGTSGLWPAIYCRSAPEWADLLETVGFSVTAAEPMSAGTPFANVLFAARKRG